MHKMDLDFGDCFGREKHNMYLHLLGFLKGKKICRITE